MRTLNVIVMAYLVGSCVTWIPPFLALCFMRWQGWGY